MSALGEALTDEGPETKGPRTEEPGTKDSTAVKALFVYNSNPGAVAPNQNAVKRGMAREDLFTVVHEQFFTDTTDYADYVLPATTFLEHTDVQGAYGHYFVQLSQQAIAPLGEARSNVWLFGELAQRMGFHEECFRDTEEDLIRQALAIGADGHSTRPEMEHITLEGLKERGHIPVDFHRQPEERPFQPYLSGKLPTPSGKIEFYSETLATQGLDPLPGFAPAVESRFGELAKRYPLEFLGRKADNYMNSTFANLDGHRRMEARTSQRLEMHPTDAAARGIAEGDAVKVWKRPRRSAPDGNDEFQPAARSCRGQAGLGQVQRKGGQCKRTDQRAVDRPGSGRNFLRGAGGSNETPGRPWRGRRLTMA